MHNKRVVVSPAASDTASPTCSLIEDRIRKGISGTIRACSNRTITQLCRNRQRASPGDADLQLDTIVNRSVMETEWFPSQRAVSSIELRRLANE